MATLTITNVYTEPVAISDIYRTLAVGEAISVTRAANDLPGMTSLMKAQAAGKVTVSMVLDSDETTSGFAQAPDTVQASDVAPVAATTVQGGLIVLYKAFTAGGGGAADDVTVVAPGELPGNVRVLDAIAYVTTAVGSSSAVLRTATAGGGTAVATVDTGTTGRKANTGTTTTAVVAASGLYLRRSDNGAAGQVVVLLRPET